MTLCVVKNTLIQAVHEQYHGPHAQVVLQLCWNPKLSNPILNQIYKHSVSYTERWYLELRRLIQEQLWFHPLIASAIQDPQLRFELIASAIVDGANMRYLLNNAAHHPQLQISAEIHLRKLNKWCAFFASLPNSHQTLIQVNS